MVKLSREGRFTEAQTQTNEAKQTIQSPQWTLNCCLMHNAAIQSRIQEAVEVATTVSETLCPLF